MKIEQEDSRAVFALMGSLPGRQVASRANLVELIVTGEQPIAPQALATFDSGARLLEALMDRTTHGIL